MVNELPLYLFFPFIFFPFQLRVYKGGDPVTEHKLGDCPSGIVGFYAENGEHGSAALAVAAGSSVYIYKNMRPYFKYCLPHIEAHSQEREVRVDDDSRVPKLVSPHAILYLVDLAQSRIRRRSQCVDADRRVRIVGARAWRLFNISQNVEALVN